MFVVTDRQTDRQTSGQRDRMRETESKRCYVAVFVVFISGSSSSCSPVIYTHRQIHTDTDIDTYSHTQIDRHIQRHRHIQSQTET